MKHRTINRPLNRDHTTISIDPGGFPKKGNGKKQSAKYNYKEILVIVFSWLIALSLVYLCYLKFKYFLK